MLSEAEDLLKRHEFDIPLDWLIHFIYANKDEIMSILNENDRMDFRDFIDRIEKEGFL